MDEKKKEITWPPDEKQYSSGIVRGLPHAWKLHKRGWQSGVCEERLGRGTQGIENVECGVSKI